MKISLWLSVLPLFVTSSVTYAGSATWNLSPSSSDWNTSANWTPSVVPNGPADVATFGSSNTTLVALSAKTTVDRIVFEVGASPYTIQTPLDVNLTLSGAGIVNESGIVQQFVQPAGGTEIGIWNFTNTAAVGTFCSFTINDTLYFKDDSSAGSGMFNVEGGDATIFFFKHATAATATLSVKGSVLFGGNATAGSATITNEGGSAPDASGGTTIFTEQSHAGSAVLATTDGTNGGGGGRVIFMGAATGETAQVRLSGAGKLDLTVYGDGVDIISLGIGSLEGSGSVLLGANNLTIGANNLSTIHTGVIEDWGPPQGEGSLTKTGTGTLKLGGANSYVGGTTIRQGKLVIFNTSGSGTGSGSVQVEGGTLGGTGTIAGAVTIGNGGRAGAFLAPSAASSRPATLTIQSLLTFQSGGTYTCKLNSKKARADQVIANGVNINNGAQFSFNTVGNKKLTTGVVFTAINNTAATPISGTFANLADGSTITVGVNKLQVSYSGGDGNDLTLTVAP